MSNIVNLWVRRRARNAGAFEDALRPHIFPLYRLACHYCGNPQDAEDLLQDLICRLYDRQPEVLAVDKLRPWLTRVLYRMFVDRFRRERLQPSSFSELESGEAGDEFIASVAAEPAEQPESEFEQQLTRERLQTALRQLAEPARILLIMHDIEDYTLAELEIILETPVGTLKSRLHRARTRLRRILLDEDGTFSPSHPC